MIGGMEPTQFTFPVLPLNRAARKLGVPARWLRDEIQAGRIPGLRAGTKVVVNLEVVANILAERATEHSGEVHE
jgi:hypothetical protein